jgi:hypothetical protein
MVCTQHVRVRFRVRVRVRTTVRVRGSVSACVHVRVSVRLYSTVTTTRALSLALPLSLALTCPCDLSSLLHHHCLTTSARSFHTHAQAILSAELTRAIDYLNQFLDGDRKIEHIPWDMHRAAK